MRLNTLITNLAGNVKLSKALVDLADLEVRNVKAFEEIANTFVGIDSDESYVSACYVWYLLSIVGEANYVTLHTLYGLADKRKDCINTKHDVDGAEVIWVVSNGVSVLQKLGFISSKYVIKPQSFYGQYSYQHTQLYTIKKLVDLKVGSVEDRDYDLAYSSKARALISLERLYRSKGIKAFSTKAKLDRFNSINSVALTKLSESLGYDVNQALMIGERLVDKHADLYEQDTLNMIRRDISVLSLFSRGLTSEAQVKFEYKIDARERIYWNQKINIAGVELNNTLQNLSISKGSIYLKNQDNYLTEHGFMYMLNELADLLGITENTITKRMDSVISLLNINWGYYEEYKVFIEIPFNSFEDWLTVLNNVKVKASKLPTLLSTMNRLYNREYSKLVASIDATASHLQIIATLTNSQPTALLCNMNGRDTINKVDILATKVLNEQCYNATGIKDLFTTSKYIIMTCGYGKSSNNLILDAVNEEALKGKDKISVLKNLQFTKGYNYTNNQDFATKLVNDTIKYVVDTNGIQFSDNTEAPSYKDFVDYFRQVLQQAKQGVKPTHFTFESMGREHTIACYKEVKTAYNKYRMFGDSEGIRALSSAVVHSYDSGILAEVSNLLVGQDLRDYLPEVNAELVRRNTTKAKAIQLLATDVFGYTPVREMVKDIASLNDLQLIHLKGLLDVIPHEEVVIMPNHDCFATHPNKCQYVLRVYKQVMATLAETNSLLHTLNSIKIFTYNEDKNTIEQWYNNYNCYKLVGELERNLHNKPMLAEMYSDKVMQSNYCLC